MVRKNYSYENIYISKITNKKYSLHLHVSLVPTPVSLALTFGANVIEIREDLYIHTSLRIFSAK